METIQNIIPEWNKLINKIEIEIPKLYIEEYNYLGLLEKQRLVFVLSSEKPLVNKLSPRGFVFQLSLVEKVTLSYFRMKREKINNFFDLPLETDNALNELENELRTKILGFSQEFFSDYKNYDLKSFNELAKIRHLDFKTLKRKLFCTSI